MSPTKEETGLHEAAAAEASQSAGEAEELRSGENTNTIEGLMKLSDAELLDLLGYNRKLAQVREDLAEMSKLTGKARELAEEKVERLLTPDISEYQFRYALEDAQREAKPKTAKAAYEADSPASVV